MAKPIILHWKGADNSFAFSKLDRTKLYGYKARQLVDESGVDCLSAHLTADGSAIIPSGGLSMVYVDDAYNTIERSGLKAIDEDGNELIKKPSTLGVAQELHGPIDPTDILDCTIQNVYQLSLEDVSEDLQKELSEGKIFRSSFSYRGDYEPNKLFLLQNDVGDFFALVAADSNFGFLERDTVQEIEEDDEDDFSDDFDFSMM